jgi:hypothetical protein
MLSDLTVLATDMATIPCCTLLNNPYGIRA